MERIAAPGNNSSIEIQLIGERARSIDVFLFVIAKRRADWNVRERMNSLDDVAANPGRDVENSHRPLLPMNFQNQIAKHFLQILPALTNPAPADAVEIRLVDQAADKAGAARFVFVNVIERKTGIEAVAPTDLDAATQYPRSFQSGARDAESNAALRL